jgi:hypothetical protein
LVQAEKFDFRNDKKLSQCIRKAFTVGLTDARLTEEEQIELRKNAYCLVFSETPTQLK